MAADFHKPVSFGAGKFEEFHGGDDPAESTSAAHETAAALLSRVRADPDPAVVERLVAYTDEHGIDEIAELWAHSPAHSLPGALWRLYLVRMIVRRDPQGTSLLYQRGSEVSTTIDPVVAGAEAPTGTSEITDLADRILRGVFADDFAVALDRAAAYCRVSSAGCTSLADDHDATSPERSAELTRRGLRYAQFAADLTACARLWRRDALD